MRKLAIIAGALFRLLLLIALFLVAVVTGVIAALQTDWARDGLRDTVVGRVNEGIQGRLSVGRLAGTLPFEIVLEDVRIDDPDGAPVLRVERVSAGLDVLRLLDRVVEVDRVAITAPDLVLFDPQGAIALGRAFQPRQPRAPKPPAETSTAPELAWTINVRSIALTEARIEDVVPGEAVDLGGLDLAVAIRVDADGIHWTDLAVVASVTPSPGLAWLVPAGGLRIASSGVASARRIAVDAFDVQLGPHALSLSGGFEPSQGPSGRVAIGGLQLDTRGWPSLTPVLHGTVSALGELSLGETGLGMHLEALTPVGALTLQAGAAPAGEGFFGGPAGLRLGEFDVQVLATDLGVPDALLAAAGDSGDALRRAVAEVAVRVDGRGLPGDPDHRAEGAVEVLAATADGEVGHALVTLRHLPVAGRIASGWGFRIDVDNLWLQPWLGLVGQPSLEGRVEDVGFRGVLSLPASAGVGGTAGAGPEIILAGGVRANAFGAVLDADGVATPLSAGAVRVRTQVDWDGRGVPVVAAFARLEDAYFGEVRAGRAVARVFSGAPGPDGVAVRGQAEVEDFAAGGFSLGEARIPLDGQLAFREGEGLRLDRLEASPDVVRLAIAGTGGLQRARGELRLVAEGQRQRVNGQLRVTAPRFTPVGADEAEIALELWTPRVFGPVALTDGAIDGTVQLRADGGRLDGGATLAELRLESAVGMARGIGGPVELNGRILADGFSGFDLRARHLGGLFGVRLVPGADDVADLIAELGLAVDIDDVRFVAPDLLARRPLRKVTLTTTRTEDGRLPLDLDVTLDDRYAFETRAEVRLPRGGVGLSAAVEAFSLRDVEAQRNIVDIEGAMLTPEGIVSVSGLVIHGPEDGAGRLTAGGYLDLRQQEVDANIDLTSVDVAAFFQLGEALLGSPIAPGLDAGGRLSADLDLYGTLKDPTLAATVSLDDGRVGRSDTLGLQLAFEARPEGLQGSVEATWRATGARLVGSWRLPGRWSLAPVSIVWDDTRELTGRLELDDEDLGATLASLDAAAGGRVVPIALGGAAQLRFDASGRPGAAATNLALTTRGLVIDDFADADLDLRVGTRIPDTTVDLGLTRRDGQSMARLDGTLPFIASRALGAASPGAWVMERLRASPAALSLNIPSTTLGRTPAAPFVPAALAALGLGVGLKYEGTLGRPELRGHVDVSGLEALPDQSVTRIQLSTVLDVLHADVNTLASDGPQWLDADVQLPSLSRLLDKPETALQLLNDPGLRVDAFSADVSTLELWRLLPAAGDIATQLMPDGIAMVHVNARGGPGGPSLHALGRLRTHAPRADRDARIDPRTRARLRNVANDILVTAELSPVRTTARALLLQEPEDGDEGAPKDDGDAIHEHLGVELLANLGTERLLAGAPIDGDKLEIQGHIDADDFRLDGLASTMRSILGSTRGLVRGRVDVDGTVGAPRFTGALNIAFSDLSIAPLGFRREDVKARLGFTEGNRVALTGLAFEEPADEGDRPSSMSIALAAVIPALDPARIRLDGGLSWWRFPVVARKDAEARISGEIRLAGTASRPSVKGKVGIDKASLSPALSSRSVRAIGLPADVTFVRGEPKPPPVKAVKAPAFQTGADVDVEIAIPAGSTHLEPALFLAVGEVRAVLEPNTGPQPLRIRTTAGRIGLFGTIFVPTESVQVYGKRFVIDEDSRIIFTGDIDSDPQLRITARYNIQHVDLSPIGLTSTRDSYVAVKVAGNAAQPEVTFLSEPRMDEGNMLSIIALGTPAGAGDAIASQARGQLLSAFLSMATLELGRGLTDTLPIEILKLDTLTGDLGDLRLTVGKRITDDLYVYYRSEWGGSRRTNTFWAEYRLGRILYVGAEYGDSPDPTRAAETSLRASVRITP